MTAVDQVSSGELAVLAAGILRVESGAFAARSFVQLGGDSLCALRFAAVARERFAASVPVSALLGAEPLSVVLSRVRLARPAGSTGSAGSAGSGPAGGVRRAVSCLPFDPVCVAFLDGPLRAELLRHSVELSVQRHPALGFRPRVALVDGGGTQAGFTDFARDCAAELGRRPLDTGPPLRFLLATSPPNRHALVVVAHHTVLDTWALGLLIDEIVTRYDASERAALAQLEPVPPARPAHRALPLPPQSRLVGRLRFDAGEPATRRVVEAAAELGVTPCAVLVGGFGLALGAHVGRERLPVAVPFAAHPSVELRRAVVAASSLAVVPAELDGPRTVAASLASVHRALGHGLEHGSAPPGPCPRACLDLHEGLLRRRLRTASLDVSLEESHGARLPFDIVLLVRRTLPSFAGELEFDPHVWPPDRARALLAEHWATVDALAAGPDAPLPCRQR